MSKCLNIEYESRDFVPGVGYRTLDGEEECTPVIKKKRIRLRGRTRTARMMGVAVKLIFNVLGFVEFEKLEREHPG